MKTALILAAPAMVCLAAFPNVSNGAESEKEFLKQAAQSQLAEIKLVEIAVKRAGSEKVKQFGEQMIVDHSKANQEVTQLARQEGVDMPKELSPKQREKADKFSGLSGEAFDKAYMEYMTKDHRKDVMEFERSAQQIQDPQVRQWARETLPVLKNHLQTAQQITESVAQ